MFYFRKKFCILDIYQNSKKMNNEKLTARKLKHIEDHENRHKTLVDFSISRTWSEKDEKRALRKLSKVSFFYDKHKHLTLQVGQRQVY